MIEASSEETLAASPEDVFDFLADVDNQPVWNPEVVTVTQVTPGPPAAGTRLTGEYKHVGRIDTEITDFDRPHRLVFQASGRQAEMLIDFRLAAVDGGTHMQVGGSLSLKGPLRFVEGAIRGVVAQQYADRARAVKHAMEQR